jgi:hypothetical protein
MGLSPRQLTTYATVTLAIADSRKLDWKPTSGWGSSSCLLKMAHTMSVRAVRQFCHAVEVKSFISPSNVSEFHTALGQFLNYRDALSKIEPDRQLYLAVRVPIYESFFQRRFIAAAVERYQLRLVTYDVQQEVITRWL